LFNVLHRTDIITLVYIFLSMCYTIIGYQRVEGSINIVFNFMVILVLMFVIAYLDDFFTLTNKSFMAYLTRFLHLWFAPFFYAYFFEVSTKIDRVIFRDNLDIIFQKWDYLIFNYQPAIEWGLRWDWAWLQELMHFSYFCYYLLILFVPLYIYIRQKEVIFKRIVFNISFVFYSCFIIYMVLPVVGGRAFEQAYQLTIEYRYGIFTHIMAYIYQASPHFGGAFPSSHVAVAVAICLISVKYFEYLPYVMIPITVLLSFSTVYCHYHYFVDMVFGVLFGLFFYYLSEKAYKKLKVVDKKTVCLINSLIISE
ncbi:MAG TPA: phosphatase PAP2 family protein, partial [Candidatus Cloacimonadota bacterium]|nr:phosphatase PAP2 family protein [Candidatus Cloacimonadota bacterium]